MKTKKQLDGKKGEDIAVKYLKKLGYKILHRNFRQSGSEIDIICSDGGYIVFAEVKLRADTEAISRFGRPGDAVNREKREHILRAVNGYMKTRQPTLRPRIDIVEIYDRDDGYSIKHIKNAFGAS